MFSCCHSKNTVKFIKQGVVFCYQKDMQQRAQRF